jgi:hypothetical protein
MMDDRSRELDALRQDGHAVRFELQETRHLLARVGLMVALAAGRRDVVEAREIPELLSGILKDRRDVELQARLERLRVTAKLSDEQAHRRVRELEDQVVRLEQSRDDWRRLADLRAPTLDSDVESSGDEYEAMSREELLARVRDWREVANDRTRRIAELEAERKAVISDGVGAEREWAVFGSDGKLHRGPWRENEARLWLVEGAELGMRPSAFHLRFRTVGDWAPEVLDPRN